MTTNTIGYMKSPNRVLVTGGFGFLGSHLVEEIAVKEPYSAITVVDNLSTSTIDHIDFADALEVNYCVASVSEYLDSLSVNIQFDQIYHLASIVGPAGVIPHAGRIASSIIEDTDLVTNAALRWQARLVDISTSEVYGGGRGGLCAEGMSKIVQAETTVRLEYAVGKLAAEIALINRTQVNPLHAVIVRPFNIAGPRQSSMGGFVLPRFIEMALSDLPLTVFGDGNQIRAFTHVKDMVTGIRYAMQRGLTGHVYNVGTAANKITINELAKRVIELTASKSEIEYVDPKTIYGDLYAEATDKYPDSMKAQQDLGWRPTRNVDTIIKDTINWMRN